jgi:hypothetical protein
MLLHWLIERGLQGFLEGVCAWLCIPPPPRNACRILDSNAGAGEPPGAEPAAKRSLQAALDDRAGRGHLGE